MREAAIGLALSLAIRVLLAAAEFAGHFVGYQIGLSIGSLIDPQSGVNNNILAILYANVTVIVFSSNLHHMLLRALADSYRALPVGLGSLNDSLVKSVSDTIGLISYRRPDCRAQSSSCCSWSNWRSASSVVLRRR